MTAVHEDILDCFTKFQLNWFNNVRENRRKISTREHDHVTQFPDVFNAMKNIIQKLRNFMNTLYIE